MNAEVEIRRVGGRGQGVGYDASGNIYFVDGAVPGDVVSVDYEEGAKRYRDAHLVDILKPSAERQAPRCEYFQTCGGCDWLHWDYSSQLEAKEAMLRHALDRAGMTAESFLPILAATRLYGYRNRIQLRTENGKVGFLKKRTHDLVDIRKCEIADEKLNLELGKIREEDLSAPKKIELAVREDGSVGRWENLPHGAGGFVQVNPEQNVRLRSLIASLVEKAQSRSALELYCGNGNLTFSYFSKLDKVIGVDSSKPAIESASAQIPSEAKEKVEFLSAWVGPQLRSRLPAFWKTHDLLILDPPRQGLAAPLTTLLGPSVRDVIYVSCSIPEFTKDASPLKKEFSLVEAHPIDMFPHTRHVEFVTWWRRR